MVILTALFVLLTVYGILRFCAQIPLSVMMDFAREDRWAWCVFIGLGLILFWWTVLGHLNELATLIGG